MKRAEQVSIRPELSTKDTQLIAKSFHSDVAGVSALYENGSIRLGYFQDGDFKPVNTANSEDLRKAQEAGYNYILRPTSGGGINGQPSVMGALKEIEERLKLDLSTIKKEDIYIEDGAMYKGLIIDTEGHQENLPSAIYAIQRGGQEFIVIKVNMVALPNKVHVSRFGINRFAALMPVKTYSEGTVGAPYMVSELPIESPFPKIIFPSPSV